MLPGLPARLHQQGRDGLCGVVSQMLCKSRSRNLAGRIAYTVLFGALTATSCSSEGSRVGEGVETPPVEIFQEQSRKTRLYAEALLRFGSHRALDWEEALHQVRELQPFHIYLDEEGLVERVLAGPDAEGARRDLSQRGRTYLAILVFTEPYDPVAWDVAHAQAMESGEFGQIQLSISLFQMLFNVQLRDVWPHFRSYLVATGTHARETAEELAIELAGRMTDVPLQDIDYLREVALVLIAFGDEAKAPVDQLLSHPTTSVRRAIAIAIGESVEGGRIGDLERLLSSDPAWEVRAAAADALGHMGTLRAQTGPILLRALERENETYLRQRLAEALGKCRYAGAVPALIKLLEDAATSSDLSNRVMEALWRITSQRLISRAEWQRWYETKYPEWLQKNP